MLRKVLFLDVDGVLNTSGKYFNKDLNPECLRELQRVITSTGADIIVSSQWRCHNYLMVFLNELIEGMGGKIVGKTQQIGLYQRIGEIENYLEYVQTPFRYAVIDDERKYFFEGDEKEILASTFDLHDHLVIVEDKTKGLTAAEANKLIDILNNGGVWNEC
ncbi:MAG: HAD domain-containing protein [Candidatus Wallbacteria bacterium]